MNITVHSTFHLSKDDWSQITAGFNRSFETEKQENELRSYYHRNLKGESYHAICRDDNKQIIAHTSVVPHLYSIQGEDLWLGLSGGSFVLKEYRQEAFLMVDMIHELRQFIQKEGIVATFGVPNDKLLGLLLEVYESNLVKYLPYYILPVRLFKHLTKRECKIGNTLSLYMTYIWLFIHQMITFLYKSNSIKSLIQLQTSEAYYQVRFNDNYQRYQQGQYAGIYRTYIERGLKATYIFDFREGDSRSNRALLKLLWHILKHERPDIVLFIGDMGMQHKILFRLPIRLEPKRLALTLKLLDQKNKELQSILTQPRNWDFGLMNFDVR